MCIFYAFSTMIRFSLFLFTFYVPLLFSMEISELSGKVTDDIANRYFLTKEYDDSVKYSSPFDSDAATINFVKSKDFQRAMTRSIEFAKNKIARNKEDEKLVNSAVPVRGYEYGRVGNISIVVEENKELRDYYRKNIPQAREFVAQYKTYLSENGISDNEVCNLFIAKQLHDDVKKIEEERSKRGMFSSVVDMVRSAIKFKPHKEDVEHQKIYKAWQQMDGEKRQSPFAAEQVKRLTPLLSLILVRKPVEETYKPFLKRPFKIENHGNISVPRQGDEADCGHRAARHAIEFVLNGVKPIWGSKSYDDALESQKCALDKREWLDEGDVRKVIEEEGEKLEDKNKQQMLDQHILVISDLAAYFEKGLAGLSLKTLHQLRAIQRASRNGVNKLFVCVLGDTQQNGEIMGGNHYQHGHYRVVVVRTGEEPSYSVADSISGYGKNIVEKFAAMLGTVDFENVADIPENFADNSVVSKCLTELEKIRFLRQKNYSRSDCKKRPQELIDRILIAARKLAEITDGKIIWTEDGCSNTRNEIRKVFRELVKLSGQTITLNGKKRGPVTGNISLATLDEMDVILNSLGNNDVEE